jgi:hypothetical protein
MSAKLELIVIRYNFRAKTSCNVKKKREKDPQSLLFSPYFINMKRKENVIFVRESRDHSMHATFPSIRPSFIHSPPFF